MLWSSQSRQDVEMSKHPIAISAEFGAALSSQSLVANSVHTSQLAKPRWEVNSLSLNLLNLIATIGWLASRASKTGKRLPPQAAGQMRNPPCSGHLNECDEPAAVTASCRLLDLCVEGHLPIPLAAKAELLPAHGGCPSETTPWSLHEEEGRVGLPERPCLLALSLGSLLGMHALRAAL